MQLSSEPGCIVGRQLNGKIETGAVVSKRCTCASRSAIFSFSALCFSAAARASLLSCSFACKKEFKASCRRSLQRDYALNMLNQPLSDCLSQSWQMLWRLKALKTLRKCLYRPSDGVKTGKYYTSASEERDANFDVVSSKAVSICLQRVEASRQLALALSLSEVSLTSLSWNISFSRSTSSVTYLTISSRSCN